MVINDNWRIRPNHIIVLVMNGWGMWWVPNMVIFIDRFGRRCCWPRRGWRSPLDGFGGSNVAIIRNRRAFINFVVHKRCVFFLFLRDIWFPIRQWFCLYAGVYLLQPSNQQFSSIKNERTKESYFKVNEMINICINFSLIITAASKVLIPDFENKNIWILFIYFCRRWKFSINTSYL